MSCIRYKYSLVALEPSSLGISQKILTSSYVYLYVYIYIYKNSLAAFEPSSLEVSQKIL